MTTVAQRTTPSKAFYAILDDTHGTLAKVDKEILFLADDGTLTVIEPVHCAFLTALGEVGISECQKIMDDLAHGAAMIACTRRQEVA